MIDTNPTISTINLNTKVRSNQYKHRGCQSGSENKTHHYVICKKLTLDMKTPRD